MMRRFCMILLVGAVCFTSQRLLAQSSLIPPWPYDQSRYGQVNSPYVPNSGYGPAYGTPELNQGGGMQRGGFMTGMSPSSSASTMMMVNLLAGEGSFMTRLLHASFMVAVMRMTHGSGFNPYMLMGLGSAASGGALGRSQLPYNRRPYTSQLGSQRRAKLNPCEELKRNAPTAATNDLHKDIAAILY